MKDRVDAILHRKQAEYLETLTPPRDPLLERMEKFAAENQHPIADAEVAQLLRVLVAAKRPRRILEIGTNIGYSVVVMGQQCGADATIETTALKLRGVSDGKTVDAVVPGTRFLPDEPLPRLAVTGKLRLPY